MRIVMLETRESPEWGRLEDGVEYGDQLPAEFRKQLVRQGYAKEAKGKHKAEAADRSTHPTAAPDAASSAKE